MRSSTIVDIFLIKSRYNPINRKIESCFGRAIVNESRQRPRGVIWRRARFTCDWVLNYFADVAGINDTERDCRRNVITLVNV